MPLFSANGRGAWALAEITRAGGHMMRHALMDEALAHHGDDHRQVRKVIGVVEAMTRCGLLAKQDGGWLITPEGGEALDQMLAGQDYVADDPDRVVSGQPNVRIFARAN